MARCSIFALSALDRPAATIDHRSAPLIAAFQYLVRRPGQWCRVDQVAQGSGASRATVYRRFDNLVMAGAVQARRLQGHRHYMLARDWRAVPLAAELHQLGRLLVLPADAFGQQGPDEK